MLATNPTRRARPGGPWAPNPVARWAPMAPSQKPATVAEGADIARRLYAWHTQGLARGAELRAGQYDDGTRVPWIDPASGDVVAFAMAVEEAELSPAPECAAVWGEAASPAVVVRGQEAEATSPNPNAWKRQRGAAEVWCTCTRSRCLKKYCVCFAAGRLCTSGTCRCTDCASDGEHTAEREAVVTKTTPTKEAGCMCARSRCLKKYCVCVKAGIPCVPGMCGCAGCENTEDMAEVREAERREAGGGDACAGAPASHSEPVVAGRLTSWASRVVATDGAETTQRCALRHGGAGAAVLYTTTETREGVMTDVFTLSRGGHRAWGAACAAAAAERGSRARPAPHPPGKRTLALSLARLPRKNA